MTPEQFRRMDDPKLPFTHLNEAIPEDGFYRKKFEEETRNLEVLNLTTDSCAGDVRRVAISSRRKMQESGLNVETVKALMWALKRTNDCGDERQFLWFLLNGDSFAVVDSARRW